MNKITKIAVVLIRKHSRCLLSGHCSVSGRDWSFLEMTKEDAHLEFLPFLSLSNLCRCTSYSVVEILVCCTWNRRKRSASISLPGWLTWRQGNFLFLIHCDLREGQMSPYLNIMVGEFYILRQSCWSNPKLLVCFFVLEAWCCISWVVEKHNSFLPWEACMQARCAQDRWNGKTLFY